MRLTPKQKYALIEEMKKTPELACGHFSGSFSSTKIKDKWEEVAMALNAVEGATKSADKWKRCWIDLKAGIKQKYTAIKNFNSRTGYIPSTSTAPKPLDALEQEVLQFIRYESCPTKANFNMAVTEIEAIQNIKEEWIDEHSIVTIDSPVPRKKRKEEFERQPTPEEFVEINRDPDYLDQEQTQLEFTQPQQCSMKEVKEDLLGIKQRQQRTNPLLEVLHFSELEQTKVDTSRCQGNCMKEVKEELVEIKQGQQRTNQLLEEILLALKK